MYNFNGILSNYSSTPCSINFSSLLSLVPISSFLLTPSDLWNTVQILVDKYIFLQQGYIVTLMNGNKNLQ